MKKVLCADEIESAYTNNRTDIEVDKNTIITPLARDLIEEYELNLKIIERKKTIDTSSNNISEELILSILKKILNGSLDDKYVMKLDSNGLKVIDGNSIHFKEIPNCKDGGFGQYCSISYGDSNNSEFGLAKLNNTELSSIAKNDTYLYVSKGSFEISIDEDSCISKEGDIIFIPKNANVTVRAFLDVELVYSLIK